MGLISSQIHTRICRAFLFGVLALFLVVPAASAALLKNVEVAAVGDRVAVEIIFDSDFAAPSSFALDGPRRLVIDLPGGEAAGRSYEGAGVLSSVRTAQFSTDTARIVLDLAGPARLATSSASGGTLRIKIESIPADAFTKLATGGRVRLPGSAAPEPQHAKAPVVAAVALPPVKAVPKPDPKPEPVAVAAAPAKPRPQPREAAPAGLPVVVIDAGHGGKDVGTISVLDGKYEKDAVLQIAWAIKRELDASGRVRAILTRSDDRYLRHRDRFAVARKARAQLFISVHADSAPVPEARGATVYTLSETASDAEAARLAAKENRSDIIAGVDLAPETGEVSDILIDLAQRETMNTSAQFAAILQREMRQDVNVRSHFHRFAGFLVLKAPDVPSVLLETGYLSNMDDSKFLFSSAGQQKIARSVRRAVEAHFLRRLAQR